MKMEVTERDLRVSTRQPIGESHFSDSDFYHNNKPACLTHGTRPFFVAVVFQLTICWKIVIFIKAIHI